MTPIRSCYAYCRAVCAQVRFKPDHAAITEELSGHILDRRDALMEQGLSQQEAEARAVAAMGDPEEVGKALNKEHSWLLGWVQVWLHWSMIALAVLIVLYLLSRSSAPWSISLDRVSFLLPHPEQAYALSKYLSESITEDFQPNITTRLDDYTLTVTRVQVRDLGTDRNLDAVLKVTYRNLWLSDPGFLSTCSAVTDTGQPYFNFNQTNSGFPRFYFDRIGAYAFVSYYHLQVTDLPLEAASFTLEHSMGDQRFWLTIPLAEEEVAS